MMLHFTSVLQWEDLFKQVFDFPFKYIVAQGFWEPSSAAITGGNFCGSRDFSYPPVSEELM